MATTECIYNLTTIPVMQRPAAGEAARIDAGYSVSAHPWVIVIDDGAPSVTVEFHDTEPGRFPSAPFSSHGVAEDGTVTAPR